MIPKPALGFSLKRWGAREVSVDVRTRLLRPGFDVPTVQHWMGHRSLETTMRYLAPASDVHDLLNKVEIAGCYDKLDVVKRLWHRESAYLRNAGGKAGPSIGNITRVP